MKSVLLFIGILIAGTTVHAETIEPVPVSSLEIVGRGVVDRETGEVLALACTEKSLTDDQISFCSEVRFVHFKDHQAFYLGDRISVPYAPNLKLEKKTMKLLLNDFFSRHETELSKNKKKNYAQRFATYEGALVIVLAFSGIITNPLVGAIGIIGGFSIVSGVMLSQKVTNAFAVGISVEVKLTDQNEWNWSASPKKTSHSNFQVLLSQVATNELTLPDRSKFYRKKFRLIRKGVEFEENTKPAAP